MRIGIMCHSSFGGSARIATELAIELAQRGHRLHLFARRLPFGSWEHRNGVQLHTIVAEQANDVHPAQLYTDWPDTEFQAFISRVLHVIAHEGLDVLHFHYAVPFAFVAAEVRRCLGAAAPLLIGTLHGTDVSIFGRAPNSGPRLAAAMCNLDALTTVSQSHARLASEVFLLPAPPQVISNFIELARFRPQSHVQSNSNGRPRLVHISNFRAVKNPQSVARVFLGIRERMEAELWLIGDGPELDGVKSILQENGASNDVRYWGLQHEVGPILAQADLLLITSMYESFCLAALEAMACGVPVLATEVGGLPEVVVHEKTGLLFPLGDHDSAVNLALSLLSDPARHCDMTMAAAWRARRFERRQIVSAYEALYQRLLDRRFDTGAAFHSRIGEHIQV